MKTIWVLIGFLVLLASQVFALGIASDYIEGDTLYLKPGDSYLYGIRLQNMEAESKTVSLTYTCEICNVIDLKDKYIIPENSKNTAINFNITMPANATKTSEYRLQYNIQGIGAGGGQIGTAIKINGQTITIKHIDAKPKENIPEQEVNLTWLIIGILIMVIVIVAALLLKSKGNQKKEGKLI